jgi:hypothetical protein
MQPRRRQNSDTIPFSRHRWVLPAAAVAVACAAAAGVVAVLGLPDEMARTLDHAPRAFVDFMFVYFPAGDAVFTDSDPVQGFFYTPLFALLMAPIAALPPPVALVTWIALQLLAAAALALVGPLLARRVHDAALPVYAAVFVTSFPVIHNFAWGQVSVFLVLGVLAGALLERRGWPRTGAALLALTIAIKYYTAVALVPFLFARSWRFVGWTVLLALVLALAVPAALLGPGQTLHFYRSVSAEIAAADDWLVRDVNAQSLPHVLARALHHDPNDAGRTLQAASWTGRLLALVLLAGAGLRARAGAAGRIDGLALALCSVPLWVPTSWPHYFVFLPFVQWLTWTRWREHRGQAPLRAGAALVLLVAGILLASLPAFAAAGGKESYTALGLLLWSDLATTAALALLVLPRRG